MWTVGDAADPLHGVGVLHHGDDALGGQPEVLILGHLAQFLAQLGERVQEELIPSTIKLEMGNYRSNYLLPHDSLDRFDQHTIYSEAEIVLILIDGEVSQIFLHNLVGEVVVDTISTIFPG